jgi:hypothetical protein
LGDVPYYAFTNNATSFQRLQNYYNPIFVSYLSSITSETITYITADQYNSN